MRRIPRLRRPSGLTASATVSSNAVSRSAPSVLNPCRASFSSSSSSSSSSSRPRPVIAPSQLYPSSMRFYSSNRQQTEATQTGEHETALHLSNSALSNISSVTGEVTGRETYQHGPYTAPTARADAARENEVADPTYVPATVGKGLQSVGDISKWWDDPKHWGDEGNFVGFKARRRITDPMLLEAVVRRAVLESFALRAVGREAQLAASWPVRMTQKRLKKVLASPAKGDVEGGVVFDKGQAEYIVNGLFYGREPGERLSGKALAGLTNVDLERLQRGWDSSWKSASLRDPRIRFAVTKRIFQLASHLVPDHQLTDIKTVQSLLHLLMKPPKPATLTDELRNHDELLDLSNVTVAKKRVTRGDKEVALGRYKLTQAEFAKRGLPARGYGNAIKGKEISRLRGGV